jgi:CheY-like chemotaxis protein
MKPLILVVDDNKDILDNIKLVLEFNKFEVLTALNGKEALKLLEEIKRTPEVIISDIIMPIMNGYDFFTAVSKNPLWNSIPFIFLTAKTSPEDIRLGKMLGVDDYLTKPFNEEDLIAIIKGKLMRNKNVQIMNKKVQDFFTSMEVNIGRSITEEEKSEMILLLEFWDDKLGPRMQSYFTKKEKFPFSIEQVGAQLFNAANFVYGQEKITRPEGVLLNVENVKRIGYAYFDSYPDNTNRSGEQQFMIALIAPKINYLESLKIRKIFEDFSLKVKKKKGLDLKIYWDRISEIFSTPL